MLIEQIDGIDFEPFQRTVDTLSDVSRPAIETHGVRFFLGIDLEPELRRDHHLVAHGCESLTHEFFIYERAVDFSGIEERDSAFDRGPNEGNHLLPGPCHGSVTGTQSHTAEPYRRDFQITLSEFALLHSCLLGPLNRRSVVTRIIRKRGSLWKS